MKRLRKLTSWQGRASRREYWRFTLMSSLLFVIITFALIIAGGVGIPLLAAHQGMSEPFTEDAGAVLCFLLFIGSSILYIWSLLAITIRRLHDLGLPGNAMWNTGASFRASFSRGTVGPNAFGADPLEN